MIVKIKKVYYCEYCKKHALLPLTKHELHCTANPNRQCGLCERTENLLVVMDKYKSQMGFLEVQDKLGWSLEDIRQPSLEDIKEDLENCPLCTFSVLRQLELTKIPFTISFDLKKEMEEWWAAVNSEQDKRYVYG